VLFHTVHNSLVELIADRYRFKKQLDKFMENRSSRGY